MKTNLNKFYLNSSKENYFNYEVHGVTFKLLPASKANKLFIEATARHSLILNDKLMNIKESERELERVKLTRDNDIGIVVDSLLVGWQGLLDEDNKEIPFSKDKAIELLKELPDFINDLTIAASNYDNFLVSDEKK